MNRLNAALCGHFINAISFVALMAGGLAHTSPKWVTLSGIVCIVLALTIAHVMESERAEALDCGQPLHELYRSHFRWYIVCATLTAAAVLLALFSLWSL